MRVFGRIVGHLGSDLALLLGLVLVGSMDLIEAVG